MTRPSPRSTCTDTLITYTTLFRYGAEREIDGDEVGEHPPHDAARAAPGRDEVEEAQNFFEHEQHRRQHERAEHREKNEPRDLAVDGRKLIQSLDRKRTRLNSSH